MERVLFVRHVKRLSGGRKDARQTSAIHLDLMDKILSICRDMRNVAMWTLETAGGADEVEDLSEQEAPG